MTQLNATHSSIAADKFFEAGAGRTNAGFIFVVKGEVEVRATLETHRFSAGTLFYLPSKLPYTARWSGTTGIEYYGIYSASTRYDTEIPDEFALQSLPKLWERNEDNVLRNIFELMATGERAQKIRAVGIYYDFYAKAITLMRPVEPVRYNPALLRAMEILNTRYAENATVAELANECFVSESRLYHLFQSELQTTPVAYRNERRIQEATQLLKNPDLSIERIASDVGFQSAARFREVFHAITGFAPSEYRKTL